MPESTNKRTIAPYIWLLLAATVPIAVLIVNPPQTGWDVAPIFESRAVVALVALALIGLLLVGPTFRPISSIQRSAITALRLAVVVLLVVFMMRPTCVTVTTKRQSATLVVMVDQSRSMQLPSASGEQTSRWTVQTEALRRAEPILAELAEDLDIKVYAYDTKPVPLELRDGKIQFPKLPDGDETDIGTSLYEAAVARELGTSLAGVVLLGDGTQTAFAPAVELFEAGRELDRRNCPLYTLAFGPAGDAAQARDVEIEYLPDQYSVFANNELTVRGTARVRLYVNNDIPVELLVEDEAGNSQVVATQTIRARQSDEPIELEFRYTPKLPGQYKLTVRAAEIPQERVTKNNELSAFLTVFEGGLKVLYLEGELRLEQKFLRRAIDASQDIELDFLWLDKRRRSSWPVDLTGTLRNSPYDVYIIGDLDASALYREGSGEDNLRMLIDAIANRGKGLIMIGGYHSFGPGSYGHSPLAGVLPIEFDPLERQDFDAKVADKYHLPGSPLLPVADDYLTRLSADNAENAQRWRALPPLLGANKFKGVKANSRVLAATEQGAPLLVAGGFGDGRVLAFAGDSTWWWWTAGRQDDHKRFWRQIVLWLAKRDDLVQDNVWIKLAQRRFNPGARVEMTAGAQTAAGDEIPGAQFTATIESPDGTKQPLSLTRQDDQVQGVLEEARQPGIYRVRLEAMSGGRKIGSARATFEVFDRDIELSNSAANPDQLRRLAERTKAHNGRAITPEELPDVLREIRRQLPPLDLPLRHTWQLFDHARDAWLAFLLVSILLGAEWALRKKWGLV